MNIEYINPFIEASQTVLKQIASLDAKLGKVFFNITGIIAVSVFIISAIY
jgi:chemotaxis protein CheX